MNTVNQKFEYQGDGRWAWTINVTPDGYIEEPSTENKPTTKDTP